MTDTTPRTVYYTATTLDGYIADPADSLDWLFVQDIDAQGPMNYDEFIAGMGALVMGSTTYEWIAAHNERTGEKWAYTIPAYVFTHRELEPLGDDIHFVSGEPKDVYDDIKAAAGDRDIWMVGGGDLAAQFAEVGLLDELMVSIAPVTLGAGRPLFPRRYALELTELAQNRAFICARYAVVGPGDWA